MKHMDADLFCQSMRLASDKALGAYMGIRGAGRPLYLPSNAKRPTASSSVLALVDSFGGLSFARRERPYNSTNHFVESLNTCLENRDDVILLGDVASNRSNRVRAFAESIRE